MVRSSPASFSASSGELSELMHGRRDFVRFQNGLRKSRGFIPLPEGPITRAPGTRFRGFSKGDARARLMAFIFRNQDAVLLEWTANALRFWRSGLPILSGLTPYEIVTSYPEAAITKLQSLQSADRIYLTDGQRHPQTLSRFALASWTIAATNFQGGPFAPRNIDKARTISVDNVTGLVALTASTPIFQAYHLGTLFQLEETNTSATPYWAPDTDMRLDEKVYFQSRVYRVASFDEPDGKTPLFGAPTISLGPPVSIGLDGEVRWTFVENGNPGAYPNRAANTTYVRGQRAYFPPGTGVPGGAGDFTAEATSFTPRRNGVNRSSGVNPPQHEEGLWLANKGGIVWEALHDGKGVIKITSVISDIQAEGSVIKRLPDGVVTEATYRWAEPAWNEGRGYPRAIGAFEQRHIYGGTFSEPRTFWTSVIGGNTDMTAGPNEDDGFSYILTSPARNTGEILSIVPSGDVLAICTAADIMIGRSADVDRAFSRETAKFTSEASDGATDADPLVIENSPLFIDVSGLKLTTMAVDGNTGRFRPEVLTQIARHILTPGAVKIVYQSLPVPMVWAVLSDGQLAGVTYVPSQQVVGFHRHDLGGVVEDIEVMPTPDGKSQSLWLVVRRTLGGVERRCIEEMQPPFIALDGAPMNAADAWHQACAVRWQGAASTVITGLGHLNGETVTAWTDKGAYPGLLVAGGQITLPRAVTSAITGIDLTDRQYIDTLDIVTGQPDGGDDGRHRVHRATGFRVHQTTGASLEVIQMLDALQEPAATPQPLWPPDHDGPVLRNGVVDVAGQKGWGHQIYLRIRPLPGGPVTLVARTPTTMITDD